MKTRIISGFLLFALYFLLPPCTAQVPQGFNYQAIARDGAGNPIVNGTLKVKLSVLSDTLGFYASGTGTYIWEEEQTNVKTNASGLFSIVFGNPLATKVQGSAASFSAVQWSATPLYIGTKIANPTTYKILGSAKLWSVPYSMVSGTLSPLNKLSVKGNVVSPDSALFEVKNINGQTIFAVYSEGVRIYVDDGVAKGATKGGFAIGGFGTAKAPSQEFLRVTRDSTRVYVNPLAKGTKGGFAIGGFAAKGSADNFLNLTKDNYFIGQSSGSKNTTGLYNSFFGFEAGRDNTTGLSNILIGYQSGQLNTTGFNNLFIGTQSGKNNLVGENNVFLGNMAGIANTGGVQSWMGSNNIIIGNVAGASNTEGGSNIFIGSYAGLANDVGNLNIYIGDRSGYSSNGVRNLFMGAYTGSDNTTGQDNIFLGNQTGEHSTTGQGNTFLGGIAGWYNGAGNYNTFLGYSAGGNMVSGNMNVFVGYGAGQSSTAGDRNTYLGYSTGGYTGASDNIFIGYEAGKNETVGNRLYIENSSNNSNNALIYGEFDNDVVKLNGTVTIRDVLKLKPRTTPPPATPAEGDIYYNSTLHKLMVYDGTAWQACW
jgi:hypothetical protein